MTYSQFGQDDFVVEFFDSEKEGYFVDVGASTDGNDTLLLEEMGWEGICIEPTGSYKSLTEKRKCICLNICVGDHRGKVQFMENTGYTRELSGVVDYYCDAHKGRISSENESRGGSSKIVEKEMKTLTDVFREQESPEYIDFLKIDVEGGEEQVLRGIDFNKYSFGIISIEGNYQEEVDACSDLLKSNGYVFIERVGIDIFFGKVGE
jgi:FkbM family methyltransferase